MKVKAQMKQLGYIDGARDVSFKSWRSGRTTHVARAGWSIPKIMALGQWSSGAFMRYIKLHKLEELDPAAVLKLGMDCSDAEE